MSDEPGGRSPGPTVGDATFDAYYFKHCCGVPYLRDERWMRFFGEIADHIVSGIQPKQVLDAGCALGLLVEALRARGVDAHGVDLSSYAIANVAEPIKPFCVHGSIADDFADRYDPSSRSRSSSTCPRATPRGRSPTCAGMPTTCSFPRRRWISGAVACERAAARTLGRAVRPPGASTATPTSTPRSSRPGRFDSGAAASRSHGSCAASDAPRRSLASTEARSFATEVQRQLADALERLSAAEDKQAEAAARQVEAERQRDSAEAARVQTDGELAAVRNQLARALDTITHMERSLFWKARRVWTTVARWIGRPT